MLRDTDSDWEGISGQPYWGVLTNAENLLENLTPESLEKFWRSGRADIAWQLDLLRAHYGPFEPKIAIDFGCGVGRLARPMAEVANHVYGIEIASGMIREALRHAPSNLEILSSIDAVPGSVDWINSTIVLQHIHPSRGFPILQKLLNKLSPDGGITIQITTFRERGAVTMKGLGMDIVFWDGEKMETLLETPPGSGTMMMYDYDLNRVMAMLHGSGVDRFTVQHSNHGGHHGAFIIGRKHSR